MLLKSQMLLVYIPFVLLNSPFFAGEILAKTVANSPPAATKIGPGSGRSHRGSAQPAHVPNLGLWGRFCVESGGFYLEKSGENDGKLGFKTIYSNKEKWLEVALFASVNVG